MRISVRTVCRNMYKQLRETKKIQRTPGRACVVLPSLWRSEKGTGLLTRPLKTDLLAAAEWGRRWPGMT